MKTILLILLISTGSVSLANTSTVATCKADTREPGKEGSEEVKIDVEQGEDGLYSTINGQGRVSIQVLNEPVRPGLVELVGSDNFFAVFGN